MSSELKPCPFCGGEVYLEEYENDEMQVLYSVTCDKCKCVCPSTEWFDTEQAAINAWNQRAERTCKVVRRDRDEYGEFAEYSCGHANVWQSWNEPKFCCWCGAKVVE